MKTAELKVISDYYDFALYLTQRIEKFPRHHRYSLGTSIEHRLQTILSLLLQAKFNREKAGFLTQANIELEILRFQVRMAKDLKALPFDSHGHSIKLMQNIGTQIGGWLRTKGGPAS